MRAGTILKWKHRHDLNIQKTRAKTLKALEEYENAPGEVQLPAADGAADAAAVSDRGDGGESAEGGARVTGEGGGRAEVSAAWSAVAVARLQALFGKVFYICQIEF